MSVTSPLRPAFTAPLAPHTGAERSYTRALKTRAFTEALDGRDVFLGKKRCVVCGAGQTEYCYILPDTDSRTVSRRLQMSRRIGQLPALRL